MEKSAWLPRMRVRESTYSVEVAILPFFFIALFVLGHGQVAAAHQDVVVNLVFVRAFVGPTVSQQPGHQVGEHGAHLRPPSRLFLLL